jgi:hypothetical protein
MLESWTACGFSCSGIGICSATVVREREIELKSFEPRPWLVNAFCLYNLVLFAYTPWLLKLSRPIFSNQQSSQMELFERILTPSPPSLPAEKAGPTTAWRKKMPACGGGSPAHFSSIPGNGKEGRMGARSPNPGGRFPLYRGRPRPRIVRAGLEPPGRVRGVCALSGGGAGGNTLGIARMTESPDVTPRWLLTVFVDFLQSGTPLLIP